MSDGHSHAVTVSRWRFNTFPTGLGVPSSVAPGVASPKAVGVLQESRMRLPDRSGLDLYGGILPEPTHDDRLVLRLPGNCDGRSCRRRRASSGPSDAQPRPAGARVTKALP
jgi:hypothetical protein